MGGHDIIIFLLILSKESNTPDDANFLDSVGSNGSVESLLCLSTLFVYRLEPGGPAEHASLKEGKRNVCVCVCMCACVMCVHVCMCVMCACVMRVHV